MIFLPGINTLDGNLSLIVKDVTNISIVSTNCSSPAVVNCYTNSGFVFESVVNLKIKCLVFVGCSKLSEIRECNKLYVALLFARCNNIQMSMVTVENSAGYGVCGKNNTGLIEVSHSIFQYNVGTETNHGGHIQLYYYNNCSCVNTTIHFTHSYFLSGSNNKSSSTASGLSLLIQCVQSTINILIQYCVFWNNTVTPIDGSGGNIFLLLYTLNNRVNIADTIIESGKSYRGGGLFISVSPNIPLAIDNTSTEYITIKNTTFVGNHASYKGGAVYFSYHEYTSTGFVVFKEKLVTFQMCTFYNNLVEPMSAAGTAIEILIIHTIPYQARSLQLLIDLQECNIFENSFQHKNVTPHAPYPCGQLYINEQPLLSINGCRIADSDCSAIMAYHSTVMFHRQVELSNNTALNGGAMYLAAQSFMYLTPHTQVYIVKNTASYGGGIFVEETSECLWDKALCFYQFSSDIQENSSLLLNTSVNLWSNKASTSGDAIFGGSVTDCYFFGATHIKKTASQIFFSVFHYTFTTSSVSSRPYGVHFCVNGKPVPLVNRAVDAYPGQTFSVPVVVVGQEDGTVPGTVVTQTDNGVLLGALEQYQSVSATACTELFYTIFSNEATTILSLTADNLCRSCHIFQTYLNITIMKCPIGFLRITFPYTSCECIVSQSLSCDINRGIVSTRPPFWLGFNKLIPERNIITFQCPFDYCKAEPVNISTSPHSLDQDVQCAHNRTGILCGACPNGTSALFGSSQCLACSNKYLFLLVAFAFAGLLLVFVIIALNLTVSQGTINGILFYANVVQVMNTIYFPPHVTKMPVLYQFISWLNLNLGIVTCFYDGMDMFSKTWLQWDFPLYLFCIAVTMILLARRYELFLRLMGRNAPSVLATLFLLSYTKVVQNTISMLNYSRLHYHTSNSLWKTVWTLDGNIQYMSAKHTVMIVAGITAILITLPCMILLLCVQCLRQVNHRVCSWTLRLKPLTDAFTGIYKDRCAFWTGHLLLLRAVLYIVAAFRYEASFVIYNS